MNHLDSNRILFDQKEAWANKTEAQMEQMSRLSASETQWAR